MLASIWSNRVSHPAGMNANWECKSGKPKNTLAFYREAGNVDCPQVIRNVPWRCSCTCPYGYTHKNVPTVLFLTAGTANKPNSLQPHHRHMYCSVFLQRDRKDCNGYK